MSFAWIRLPSFITSVTHRSMKHTGKPAHPTEDCYTAQSGVRIPGAKRSRTFRLSRRSQVVPDPIEQLHFHDWSEKANIKQPGSHRVQRYSDLFGVVN